MDELSERKLIQQVAKMMRQRERRLFAAYLALRWGHGGVKQAAYWCGISRITVWRAVKEVKKSGG